MMGLRPGVPAMNFSLEDALALAAAAVLLFLAGYAVGHDQAAPPRPKPREPQSLEGLVPLPAPVDCKTMCPVCGWNPCTDGCRLGLNRYDVEMLEARFDDRPLEEGFPGEVV